VKENDIILYESFGFDLIPCIVLRNEEKAVSVDYWFNGELVTGKVIAERVTVIGSTEDFGIDWVNERKRP
jgi:hypothetical protein